MSFALLLVVIASGDELVVEWSAPDGCPTLETVRARVGPLSGRAAATVSAQGTGWLVSVVVGESTRQLTAKTCEEATDAAVLIIQLGLRPRALSPPPPVLPPSPPVETPAPEPPRRLKGSVGVSAGMLGGWLPQPMPKMGVVFTLSLGAAQLLVQAHTSAPFPQRYALAAPAETAPGVELASLVDAQVGGCWVFSFGRFGVAPCAVAGVSALSARGRNVLVVKETVVAVPHGGPGVRVTFSLTPWLEVSLAGFGRASAVPLVSVNDTEVVRASWLSAELTGALSGTW